MSSKQIIVGGVAVGGGAEVSVQSMLSARWNDTDENIRQAKELASAGCDILRLAIPNKNSISLIDTLKQHVSIPLVADIHFDYRLAVGAVAAGVDKVRINPGNIGGIERVRAVASACAAKNIPIRIGVNSGSLEREILAKYGAPTPEAMVESALYHVSLLNQCDFDHIALSLKSSDIRTTIEANRLISQRCDYPLHLGVTEAGTERMGLLRSAMGIGGLLLDGIGDTIRVSLTADPVKEIYAARDILRAAGISGGVHVVSCPTCGRCRINLIELASKVESALEYCEKPITVAVMGCEVNGPGEAREADVGVAGGDGVGLLFKKGEIVKKVPQQEILDELLAMVDDWTGEDE